MQSYPISLVAWIVPSCKSPIALIYFGISLLASLTVFFIALLVSSNTVSIASCSCSVELEPLSTVSISSSASFLVFSFGAKRAELVALLYRFYRQIFCLDFWMT